MRSRNMRRRKQEKENLVYFSDEEMMSAYSNISSTGADEEYEQLELKRIIRDIVMNELSYMQRTAIVYVFYEGYTHKQAAELMGVGKSTIDSYISRALARIKKRLENKGVM